LCGGSDVTVYAWVLLDVDNTLFDYDRAEAVALEQSLREVGMRSTPVCVEEYRRINAQLWKEYERGKIDRDRLRVRRFELTFEALHLEADAEAFSARYLEHLGRCAYLIEGAEATVKALAQRVGLVLITNGFARVQRARLGRSPLQGLFRAVIVSEEVGAAKPDPRIFDAAFAAMGNPPKAEVLMVGDGLSSDIAGANGYGVDACWYNPAHAPLPPGMNVRYRIDRLDGLLEIVSADRGVAQIVDPPRSKINTLGSRRSAGEDTEGKR